MIIFIFYPFWSLFFCMPRLPSALLPQTLLPFGFSVNPSSLPFHGPLILLYPYFTIPLSAFLSVIFVTHPLPLPYSPSIHKPISPFPFQPLFFCLLLFFISSTLSFSTYHKLLYPLSKSESAKVRWFSAISIPLIQSVYIRWWINGIWSLEGVTSTDSSAYIHWLNQWYTYIWESANFRWFNFREHSLPTPSHSHLPLFPNLSALCLTPSPNLIQIFWVENFFQSYQNVVTKGTDGLLYFCHHSFFIDLLREPTGIPDITAVSTKPQKWSIIWWSKTVFIKK